MKAPDKIYLDGDIIPFNSINERLSDKDIEYIRKDTLLEWMENELKKLENGRRPSYIEVIILQKVIDKLNAL